MSTGAWEGGKGSRPRPYSVSQKEFQANFERIFGNATTERKEQKDYLQEHQDRDGGRQATESGNRHSNG